MSCMQSGDMLPAESSSTKVMGLAGWPSSIEAQMGFVLAGVDPLPNQSCIVYRGTANCVQSLAALAFDGCGRFQESKCSQDESTFDIVYRGTNGRLSTEIEGMSSIEG